MSEYVRTRVPVRWTPRMTKQGARQILELINVQGKRCVPSFRFAIQDTGHDSSQGKMSKKYEIVLLETQG